MAARDLFGLLTVAFRISIAASMVAPRRVQGRWLVAAIAIFLADYLLCVLTAQR